MSLSENRFPHFRARASRTALRVPGERSETWDPGPNSRTHNLLLLGPGSRSGYASAFGRDTQGMCGSTTSSDHEPRNVCNRLVGIGNTIVEARSPAMLCSAVK